jgi:hypothetical protein
MLMPHTSTVRMTVKLRDTTDRSIQINSLEGSLIIEWE